MNLNWKRIGLLIGFVIAVFIIGYILYFLFLKPSPQVTPIGDTNANVDLTNGGLPQAGTNANIQVGTNINGSLTGGVNINNASQIITPDPISGDTQAVSETANGGLTKTTPLTTTKAYQATLSSDGNTVLYYDKSTGLFYRIGPNGKPVPISDNVFFEIEEATWAPNSEKAVIEYPDGSNVVYDFSTNKQVTLPKHWKDFSFSPGSDQLVLKSIGLDEANRWLAVANADGSRAVKLEHLGDKDQTVHTNWSPNNQIVAMYREDKDFDNQNLFFVGLNGENFRLAVVNGRGFEEKWSTNGDKLLYSSYSSETEYKPSLWIMDAQGDQIGQNRKNLKLETWAEKCSFANNNEIYCAVPRSLDTGAGIFKQDFDTQPTDLYKVDLKTGFKTKIATPDNNYNIDNVIVTENGDYLYFTDKTTGRLYSVRLK